MKRVSSIWHMARLPVFWLLVCAAGLPVKSMADTTGYVSPSVAVGVVYDDNIFNQPADRESDTILRVSPALEAGFESESLTLDGFYTFDAERYRKHPGLNSNTVRRDAALDLGWRATSRLNFGLDGDYTSTETPSQISPLTSLGLGRAHATAYTVNPSLNYAFDETDMGRAGYSHTAETVAQGPDTSVDTANFGWDHTVDPRNILDFDLSGSRYHFSTFADSVSSEVFTVGWTHALTPRTTLILAAGPRDTAGNVDAEVSGGVHHVMDSGTFAFDFLRSQTLVVGQVGVVETRSVNFSYDEGIGQDLEIQIAPSYAQDSVQGSRADIYRFNFSTSYRLGRITSLVGSYQYSLQRGLLGGDQNLEVRDNILYIGLVFSAPMPQGSAFDQRRRTPFETLWPAPRQTQVLPPSSDLPPTPTGETPTP